MNEYMTGTADLSSVYSAITLALLEDSGWYQANYSQAQTLQWGYQKGCAFPQQRCSLATWGADHFCTTPAQMVRSSGLCRHMGRWDDDFPHMAHCVLPWWRMAGLHRRHALQGVLRPVVLVTSLGVCVPVLSHGQPLRAVAVPRLLPLLRVRTSNFNGCPLIWLLACFVFTATLYFCPGALSLWHVVMQSVKCDV